MGLAGTLSTTELGVGVHAGWLRCLLNGAFF